MSEILCGTCQECGYSKSWYQSRPCTLTSSGEIVFLRNLGDVVEGESPIQAGFRGRHVIITALPCRHCGGAYLRMRFDMPSTLIVCSLIPLYLIYLIYWCYALITGIGDLKIMLFLLGFFTLLGRPLVSRFLGCIASKINRTSISDIVCCDRPSLTRWPIYRIVRFPCPSCGALALRYTHYEIWD